MDIVELRKKVKGVAKVKSLPKRFEREKHGMITVYTDILQGDDLKKAALNWILEIRKRLVGYRFGPHSYHDHYAEMKILY